MGRGEPLSMRLVESLSTVPYILLSCAGKYSVFSYQTAAGHMMMDCTAQQSGLFFADQCLGFALIRPYSGGFEQRYGSVPFSMNSRCSYQQSGRRLCVLLHQI